MRPLSLPFLCLVRLASAVWLSAHGDPQQSATSPGFGPLALSSSWTRSASALPQPPPTSVGFTPLFDASSVFVYDFSGSGSLTRLNAVTGTTEYTVGLNTTSPLTNGGIVLVPLPADSGAASLVALVTPDGALCALDARTGQPVWRASVQGARVVSAPAASGPRVFVRLDDSTIRAYATGSGVELWRTQCGIFPVDNVVLQQAAVTLASPASQEQCSFTSPCTTLFTASLMPSGSPCIQALDAATGAMLWSSPLPPELTPTSELVAGGSALFFGCAKGVAAVSAVGGALLWRRAPSGAPDIGLVTGAPVYSSTLRLLMVSQLLSGLFALQVNTGENAWFSPFSFSAVSPALDARGVLYSVTVDGNVGAFAGENGTLLASIAAPLAAGASSPALDGRGRLAFYSSTTATLTVLGGGLPPSPPPPSGGEGLPQLPLPARIVTAAALAGAALAAGAAWRWRWVGGGKGAGWAAAPATASAAVAPRQQRSAATSTVEWDSLYSASGGGGSGAVAVTAPSAIASALEPLLVPGGGEVPGLQAGAAVLGGSRGEVGEGWGTLQVVVGRPVQALGQALGQALQEEWSQALHTEPSFSTSLVVEGTSLVVEGGRGGGEEGIMEGAPQLQEIGEGDSFVLGGH